VIEELASKVGSAELRVSPSAGLEYLPREKARAKLNRLCEVARKVGG
jgi:methionine synthase II (cobalamin-independent)